MQKFSLNLQTILKVISRTFENYPHVKSFNKNWTWTKDANMQRLQKIFLYIHARCLHMATKSGFSSLRNLFVSDLRLIPYPEVSFYSNFPLAWITQPATDTKQPVQMSNTLYLYHRKKGEWGVVSLFAFNGIVGIESLSALLPMS